ncbi:MAG: hypothetical protein LBK13_06090 [Spirochaetales bacterium]|jgi:hypothetical protein|nr:hypothetical protein [Spirochaetales bacterium]
MQILWAFRYNPLRIGSSEPTHEIAGQQFHGQQIAKGNLLHITRRSQFWTKLRGLPPSAKRSGVHVFITTGCRRPAANTRKIALAILRAITPRGFLPSKNPR